MVNPILMPESGIEGNVSPGWRRWLRARDAAEERPNTEHAKLYMNRLALANLFTDYLQPRRHGKYWDRTQTDYWTCSDFCEALDFQRGRSGPFNNNNIWNHLSKFELTWDTRKHSCFVCNRKWNTTSNETGIDDTNRVDFYAPHVYPPVLTETKKEAPVKETFVSAGRITEGRVEIDKPAPTVRYVDTVSGRVFRDEPKISKVELTAEETILFNELPAPLQESYLVARAKREA